MKPHTNGQGMTAVESPSAAGTDDFLELAEARAIRDVEEARQGLKKLEEKLTQIRHLRGGGAYKYANKEFIDAYREHLTQTDRPWTAQQLISEALTGGCYMNRGEGPNGKAKGDPEVQARKSLIYFMATVEEKQKKRDAMAEAGKKYKKAPNLNPPALRERNGLIGLAEWPDKKFDI